MAAAFRYLTKAAPETAGVRHTSHLYEGAQHGFNNDTTPRYDNAAATLAWQRTLDFFGAHLRSSGASARPGA